MLKSLLDQKLHQFLLNVGNRLYIRALTPHYRLILACNVKFGGLMFNVLTDFLGFVSEQHFFVCLLLPRVWSVCYYFSVGFHFEVGLVFFYGK